MEKIIDEIFELEANVDSLSGNSIKQLIDKVMTTSLDIIITSTITKEDKPGHLIKVMTKNPNVTQAIMFKNLNIDNIRVKPTGRELLSPDAEIITVGGHVINLNKKEKKKQEKTLKKKKEEERLEKIRKLAKELGVNEKDAEALMTKI